MTIKTEYVDSAKIKAVGDALQTALDKKVDAQYSPDYFLRQDVRAALVALDALILDAKPALDESKQLSLKVVRNAAYKLHRALDAAPSSVPFGTMRKIDQVVDTLMIECATSYGVPVDAVWRACKWDAEKEQPAQSAPAEEPKPKRLKRIGTITYGHAYPYSGDTTTWDLSNPRENEAYYNRWQSFRTKSGIKQKHRPLVADTSRKYQHADDFIDENGRLVATFTYTEERV